MNKTSVVCIGSASRDIFFPLDDVKILNTPEDLTAQKHMMLELGAKYRTEDRFEAPGGCALNVSLALARLGVESSPYCVVGDDTYGAEVMEELLADGVNTEFLVRERGVGTDVSCILVDTKSADRTIVYNRDANERLRVKSEDISKGSAVFVSGLYGNWQENIETILKGADANESLRLYYNPGQRNISDSVETVTRMISKSEIVFLNKDEATEIALKTLRSQGVERAYDECTLARMIQSLGVRYAVITDGARGAWVYNGEACYFARAKKIDHIIDATGAGDAFAGGFLAGHRQGRDMAQCLRFGIANGTSVVQHYGAKDGLLTAKEIAVASEDIRVEVV